ncbi:hypothetical protein GJAV_G00153230 [Gymnothorax javanicus]|nr:hypothetical protein GJAV_G00153230 [Gymnothorax javanicus]
MQVILTDAVRNERTAEAFLSALRDEDPFLFNDLETNGPRKNFVRSRPPTEPFDLWSANRGLRNIFETRRDEFNVVDILVECNLLTVEEYDDIWLARERPLFLVLHEIMTRASPEHVAFLECLEGLYRDVWPTPDTEVVSQDDTHQQRIEKTFSGHGNYDIIDVNSAMTPKATVEDVWWCPICTIHRAEHAFGCGHVTCATCDRKTGNKCPLCRRRKEKVYKEAFTVKNAHMQCPECKGPKMVLIYDGPNGEGCHHVAWEQHGEEFGKITMILNYDTMIRKVPAIRDGDFPLAERWEGRSELPSIGVDKNNIPFTFKKISLFEGEQHGEEFGKITMIRKVPAIRDGDFTLAESIAILIYMAEKYHTPDHWYPADMLKRARVNEYLSWQHTAMRMHGLKIFWFKIMIPKIMGQEFPKERMDSAMEDLEGSLNMVEKKFLQDWPFIAGSEISLADLVAIVEIMQPVAAGVDVFSGRPKLTAWRDRVQKEIGKDLFDEAHQTIMSAPKMVESMDPSKLEGMKPRVKRMFF